MSWSTLPDDVRQTAERELTEKQLRAFRLECDGHGTRSIAEREDASRGAIMDRLALAHRKLERCGVKQDASGQWYIKEAA